MTRNHILLVDDDKDLCELIAESLGGKFAIQTCHDGQAAKALTEELKPSIIILDINLPDESGVALCKSLHSKFGYSPLILLISGDGSLDQRLKAYESGSADFLAKPFSVQELLAKVDVLVALHSKNEQLEAKNSIATKTAMNAMVEASQYGEVLRFYNGMYRADSVEAVKSCFFTLMASFQLTCSVQFRVETTYTFDFDGGDCSPIESQIFESLCESDRLISFGSRMMVNGRFCSFIVKNMPIEDEVTNGRLRDILATLIEGLDAKLLDLQRLNLLRQTSRELAQSSQRLTQVMLKHENYFTNALNTVISEINASFHKLEMTEAQETFFTGLTENILHSMEESFIEVGNETDVLDCIRLSLSAVLNDRKPQG